MQYIKHSSFIGLLLLIGIATHPFRSVSQKKISGCYSMYLNSICIKPDSTFRHQWRYHIMNEWANGKWSVKNDTLYFEILQVHDTLIYEDNYGIKITKVVLSNDENPERITLPLSEYPSIPYDGHDQGDYQCPRKLFFRNDKLFQISARGKLAKQTFRRVTTKRFVPWYVKVSESP